MVLKIIFAIAAVLGIVAVFYVSWFWRALIGPMIILLLVDLVGSFWNKRKEKKQ